MPRFRADCRNPMTSLNSGCWQWEVSTGIWKSLCSPPRGKHCRVLFSSHDTRLSDWKASIYPDDVNSVFRHLGMILENKIVGGHAIDMEYRLKNSEGKWCWVMDTFYFEWEEDSKVPDITVVRQDVNKQKLLQLENSQNSLRYKTLLDMAPVGIFECDLQGFNTFANEWWRRGFNLTPKQIEGFNWREYIPRESLDCMMQNWSDFVNRSIDDPKVRFTASFNMLCPQKAPVPVVSTSAPVYDDKESVIGYVGVIQDISETVNRQKAENWAQMKTQLVAHVSHEVRTLVHGILGISEILIQDESLSSETKESVQSIVHCGAMLSSLIDDILLLSKIESGKIEITERACRIVDCIEAIFSILSVKAKENRTSLFLNLNPDVPRSVYLDSSRLGQILLNLVGNAIKHTCDGEVIVSIERNFEASGEFLLFSVSDNGLGISKSFVSQLFGEYSKDIGSKVPGTGLGLSIAKKLVELMKGRIWLESTKENCGTKFSFQIPLKEANDLSNSFCENSPKLFKEDLSEFNILVVDDNSVNRKICSNLLQKMKFQFETASNGKSALDMVHQSHRSKEPFDLILMDIQMPELNGIECTHAIRRIQDNEFVQPKIIAVTAQFNHGQDQILLSEGFDACLSKPISANCLFNKILEVLQIN